MSEFTFPQEYDDAPLMRGAGMSHDVGLSVDEAAVRLGVCRRLVYELIEQGRLHAITIGKRRIVPASSINALLRSTRT